MKNSIKMLVLFLLLTGLQTTFAQSDKENALAKAKEAITFMDNGKIDESITLLVEARKLDPGNFIYSYELAYAHYLKEDYKEAINIAEKELDHKDVSARGYQLVGNSYDVLGNSEKAFKVYDAGLKKFPNSGMLFLEKGNVHWNKKEYEKALPYYEQGIEMDPKFPSNYYRAARIYCNSSEAIWGVIYGEIFMNLERNSKRTIEISELLYDTYKSRIKIKNDSSSIDFCRSVVMSIDDISKKRKIKLPFCMVFGQALIMAILDTKSIDISSLNKIRTAFVENYYRLEIHKTHPNILFDYQNEMLKSGHLEAYNHWVLMKGDEAGFDNWLSGNKDKWDQFVKWFTSNGLKIDPNNKFYRAQY